MSDTIRDVLNALRNVEKAFTELGQCRREAGYEADYFCHHQREALAGAEERLDVVLSDYIMAKVITKAQELKP